MANTVQPQETLELGGQVVAVNEGDTLRSDSLHWMRAESRYRFWGATEWMGTDVRFSCLSGDIVMDEEPLGWLAGQVKVDDGEGTVQGDSLSWGASSSEVWGHVVLAQSDGTGTVHGRYALRQEADSLELVIGDGQQRAWLQQIDEGDTLRLAADTLQRKGEVPHRVSSRDARSRRARGEWATLWCGWTTKARFRCGRTEALVQ